ncbi:hypothetical protein G2W53_006452 [Senna tora]|uniref:Uncharacterized protein n=1 Tax=Senna tora TaxID=362788 RepID=A0A834X555_9FABA|nr:hypothetical protein G2W53_006452 [Senna tora]
MEAHKERKEQVEREEGKKHKYENMNNEEEKKKSEIGGAAKRIIGESIISSGNKEAPDDVLAFSRSVHNVDSSLQ